MTSDENCTATTIASQRGELRLEESIYCPEASISKIKYTKDITCGTKRTKVAKQTAID